METEEQDGPQEEYQVLIQQKFKELEELQREKQNIHEDKEKIQTELQAKEERLRIEAREKENLELMLKELEQKLVVGG